MSALQASLETTPPGSTQHWTVALMGALVMLLVCADGLRGRASGRDRALARRWAIGILLVQAPLLFLSFTPRYWDVNTSLPLHLCDVAVFVVAAALWTQRRALRALAYFWALGLSSQAFVTPLLRSGPLDLGYWFFWVAHTQVVGGALYDVVVLRFRPRARDLRTAFGFALGYAALVLPLDLWLGVNYGFLGREDLSGSGTLLAALPPWPGSLALLVVAVAAWFTLLWLPWAAAALCFRGSAQSRSSPR